MEHLRLVAFLEVIRVMALVVIPAITDAGTQETPMVEPSLQHRAVLSAMLAVACFVQWIPACVQTHVFKEGLRDFVFGGRDVVFLFCDSGQLV